MTPTAAGAARAALPPPPDEATDLAALPVDRDATRLALDDAEADWHARLRTGLAARLDCDERLADEALRFAYRQLLEQGIPEQATAAAAARIAFQHAARASAEQEARQDGEPDAFAQSLAFPPGEGKLLRTVTDPDGRQHKLRYLHPLVADCCELTAPRLVCELIDGEGEPQARAAAGAYADQLKQGGLLGPSGEVGQTRAASRRAGVTPA